MNVFLPFIVRRRIKADRTPPLFVDVRTDVHPSVFVFSFVVFLFRERGADLSVEDFPVSFHLLVILRVFFFFVAVEVYPLLLLWMPSQYSGALVLLPTAPTVEKSLPHPFPLSRCSFSYP